MSKPVDLEMNKAFNDLQDKMAETTKKIQVIDSQINVLQRVFQHVSVTQSEITAIPSETTTYEAVGRMFMQTDFDEVKTNLNMRVTELADRIASLENNKKDLEENLKEIEDNIREMGQLRKDQGEKST